jgi:hypothetical protein
MLRASGKFRKSEELSRGNSGGIMTPIRNERSTHQRRRAGATLALAAATGGLLAAAMAGSPIARADDPYTDTLGYVQNEIMIGDEDYSAAAGDFSTAGDTNAGLAALFAGFDNTFIGTTDYTLLGLTAADTGTDFSGFGSALVVTPDDFYPLTAAGETANATDYAGLAATDFQEATPAFAAGEYFIAVYDELTGSYLDVLSGQADSLAALFSAGL